MDEDERIAVGIIADTLADLLLENAQLLAGGRVATASRIRRLRQAMRLLRRAGRTP